MDIVAARSMNYLYIYLDILWLFIFIFLLLHKKRHVALIAGLIGGLVYFAIDYGVFYLLLGTRVVTGADPFWFLLWLSMSYGLTNIAWIWLLLDRDTRSVEWSAFIIIGWIMISFVSQSYNTIFPPISIQRGTAYHGIMSIALAAGYLYLIVCNLKSSCHRVDILRLMAIGIGIQFSWEAALLLSGIRPPNIYPLIINSLIETNLGMPYFYLIHRFIEQRSKKDHGRHPGNNADSQKLQIA